MPASQDILKDWHEFYLLIGTAAAALIALLFVAASIGAGFMPPEHARARRTYMSPVIFHFTSILSISLVVLVPSHPRESHSLLIALNGIVGAAASTAISARLFTFSLVDWFDHLGYGLAPIVAYIAILAAGLVLYQNSAIAPDLLAAGLVLLLLANIRNAWDLALTIASRRSNPSCEMLCFRPHPRGHFAGVHRANTTVQNLRVDPKISALALASLSST